VPAVTFALVVEKLLTKVVQRLQIEGASMSPTYLPGERVSVLRKWRRIRVGDVVAFDDPRAATRLLLKRCTARQGSQLWLEGDNPSHSTDSRDFGPVEASAVHWLVWSPRPYI